MTTPQSRVHARHTSLLSPSPLLPPTAVSKQMYDAFRDIGFVSVVNHGIETKVLQSTFASAKAFFALPAAEKTKVAWTTAEANRGYLGVGMEMLHDGKPDLKETFECGHEADPDHMNLWPSEAVMPGFRKTMLNFFYKADKVHLQVLRSIALGMGLPSPQHGLGNYFAPLCNGNHQNLRLLHYPACKRSEAGNRAGEHTDYGSITMYVVVCIG
jgi:isopenicillin N synthase-like dioxygenase